MIPEKYSKQIEEDLNGRKYMGLEGVDDETASEIRAKWSSIISAANEEEREACAKLAGTPPLGAWFRCPNCKGEKLALTNGSILLDAPQPQFQKWKCLRAYPKTSSPALRNVMIAQTK